MVAIVLQIPITADRGERFFTTGAARVVNLFFYFTIVFLTCSWLRYRPGWRSAGGRCRVRWRRYTSPSLVNIVITGVVYHVMLAADNEPEGVGVFTDLVFHTAAPILAVGAWLVFGPGEPSNGKSSSGGRSFRSCGWSWC